MFDDTDEPVAPVATDDAATVPEAAADDPTAEAASAQGSALETAPTVGESMPASDAAALDPTQTPDPATGPAVTDESPTGVVDPAFDPSLGVGNGDHPEPIGDTASADEHADAITAADQASGSIADEQAKVDAGGVATATVGDTTVVGSPGEPAGNVLTRASANERLGIDQDEADAAAPASADAGDEFASVADEKDAEDGPVLDDADVAPAPPEAEWDTTTTTTTHTRTIESLDEPLAGFAGESATLQRVADPAATAAALRADVDPVTGLSSAVLATDSDGNYDGSQSVNIDGVVHHPSALTDGLFQTGDDQRVPGTVGNNRAGNTQH